MVGKETISQPSREVGGKARSKDELNPVSSRKSLIIYLAIHQSPTTDYSCTAEGECFSVPTVMSRGRFQLSSVSPLSLEPVVWR